MYTCPAASTATCSGSSSRAAVAGPPSPSLLPYRTPVPATVRDGLVGVALDEAVRARRDLAHDVGAGIGHEQIAGRPERESGRAVQHRLCRRTAVAAIAGNPAADHRRHRVRRCVHPPDARVAGIREEHVPRGIEDDRHRLVEGVAAGRAVARVSGKPAGSSTDAMTDVWSSSATRSSTVPFCESAMIVSPPANAATPLGYASE